jgi:folate-binding protein YgfZ
MSQRTPLYEVAATAGAVFADEEGWILPAHFGKVAAEYDAARQHAAVFDVSHNGKVEARGVDARSFLHNLCTNDVKKLKPGEGCEAFLTTHKAKVVAPVLIYHLPTPDQPETFWLDTGPGLGPKVVQYLDRFLISEQVELTDHTTDFAQFHLAGPDAATVLSAAGIPIAGPSAPRALRLQDTLGLPGYDVFCPVGQAEQVWRALTSADALPAGGQVYELLRVEAGTPRYGAEMDEDRFVVEIGRGEQAISYTKGCYLGQEPIVMARDRGHVNRWLRGLKLACKDSIPRGARLFRGADEVGRVTSAVDSPRLGPIALAYLRRGSHEPGTAVEVETETGRCSAEVASLPFGG